MEFVSSHSCELILVVRICQQVVARVREYFLLLVFVILWSALIGFNMLRLDDVHAKVQDGEIVEDLRVNSVRLECVTALVVDLNVSFLDCVGSTVSRHFNAEFLLVKRLVTLEFMGEPTGE